MKKQLLSFLSAVTFLPLCNGMNLSAVRADTLTVDYTNGTYQMWQQQSNVKNLLLGNSMYTYYYGEIRMSSSIRIKKPSSGYLTLALEFSDNLSDYSYDEGPDFFYTLKNDDGTDFEYIATRISGMEDIDQDVGNSAFEVTSSGNKLFIQLNCASAPDYLTLCGDNYSYGTAFEFQSDASGHTGLLEKAMLYDGKASAYSYECPKVGIGQNSPKIYNTGSSYSYTVNYDNLLTLDDILKNITAYDYNDGKSVALSVKNDTYSNAVSAHQLGSFSAEINATNSTNVTSSLTLNLSIVDTTKPVIQGTKNIVVSYQDMPSNKVLNLNDYLYGYDNFDGKLSLDASSTYFYPSYFTSQAVNVSVTDSSGNKTTERVSVLVTDDVDPVIEGPETIDAYQYQYKSTSKILEMFTCSDGEGSGIKEVKAVNDNFSGNEGAPGTYTLTVQATDYFGNVTTKNVTVNVSNSIGPVFFINVEALTLTTSSLVSAASVVSELMANGSIPEKDYVSSEYITTNYEENYDKVGSYETEIVSYDHEGNADYYLVTLNVVKKEKTGFFARIWSKIVSFFKNFFGSFGKLWSGFTSFFHR